MLSRRGFLQGLLMAVLPQVIGPSGTVYSRNADAERTINWYVEPPDGGALGKNPQGMLVPRPGLTPFCTLTAGPVRGMWAMDGRMFAVGGNFLEEVFASGHSTVRGDVGLLDDNPVTFASSGTQSNQLAISSSGQLYVYDLAANTFTHVTSINFMQPVQTIVFFDSTFITLRQGTRQIYYSALLDATAWDPSQVIEVSLFADNLVQMAVSHETIWLFGSQHALPYTDTGDQDIPYQPISETVMENGVWAPWSVAQLDNTLFWLQGNANGNRQVMRLDGYQPKRISSFSLETFLNRAESTDAAIGWCYEEAGHAFYQLYVPNMETTWVYDVATNLWCERSHWSVKYRQHRPHRGRNHVVGFGYHLVGDRSSGTIYRQSLDLTTDVLIPDTDG